jgi:hypothetical protein
MKFVKVFKGKLGNGAADSVRLRSREQKFALSYERGWLIWRSGPAMTHSHWPKKIITNVGEQPYSGLFGTLRPEMKSTRLSRIY